MPITQTRTGIVTPGPGDAFKPASVDFPALGSRLEAIMVQYRQALSAQQVRDVGEVGQIRAGRVLTPADFTAMGLAAPLGLWNLSNVNDSSGAGRNLTNKGTVPFGTGIMSAATEAAVFAGSTGQALYIADTGAADPFRIRAGSWGCWFRTAKRGVPQSMLGKWVTATANRSWLLRVTATNVVEVAFSPDGAGTAVADGTSDVADDRWHFVVATWDAGRGRLYLDGAAEGAYTGAFTPPFLFASAAPVNVGGYGADGTAAATEPFYGRVDEAFVTSDVLSPEQVLNLYCSRIAHTLANGAGAALAPSGARMAVRRRRRGGVLATTDFPATPVRLHNFTAGALTDAGSGGVALTANPGTGAIVAVAAPDGARDGAYSFSGAHTGLTATDTGLPATTASRSFGAWFKTASGALAQGILAWGTVTTAMAQLNLTASGTIALNSGADSIAGPFVADGLWHFAVGVEENAPADGVKRKLYLDGRLVAGSTVLNSITLVGAGGLKVGTLPGGGSPLVGQADAAFVYAGTLTPEQIHALYNIGSLALAASPKDEAGHVEAMETTGILAQFAALEGTDLVDLSVVG